MYNSNGYIEYAGNSSITTTGLIPIDPNKKYEYYLDVKSNNNNAQYLIGLYEYDADLKIVLASHTHYIDGTLTTLSSDLNTGDQVVYLSDMTNWYTSSDTPYYQRGIKFWNYQDSTGYNYPENTYSYNNYNNLYLDSNVNKTNKTITLNSPWSGPSYPAGTKLSQASDGGTFNYALAWGAGFLEWKHLSNTSITGYNPSGTNCFRYGTKFVKIFVIPNYDYAQSNVVTYVKNIIFREVNN